MNPDWVPPKAFDAGLGRLDRIACGHSIEAGGRTRIFADWLPTVPGTRFPYLETGILPPADTHGFAWQTARFQRVGPWQLKFVGGSYFLRHEGAVRTVRVSPDGRLAVSVASNDFGRLWDVFTGREIRTFGTVPGAVHTAAFSPDGRRLATVEGQVILVWDLAANRLDFGLTGHTGDVCGIEFSRNGRFLATAGTDRTIRLWRLDHAEEWRTLVGHSGAIVGLAIAPESNFILSASTDGSTRLWSVEHAHALAVFAPADSGAANGIALAPPSRFRPGNGSLVAITSWADGTARLWDARHNREILRLATGSESAHAVGFSPTADRVFVGASDGNIREWHLASAAETDAPSRTPTRIFQGHHRAVTTLDVSPDGRYLISGSDDGTARLWEVASGGEIEVGGGHSRRIFSLAIAPDRPFVASGSHDHTARLWSLETGHECRVFRGHTDAISSLAFVRGHPWLVTGSWDRTARVWDIDSGEMRHTFDRHQRRIHALSVSPDGRLLATASDDGSVRLWDLASGEMHRRITGHGHGVHLVAFSPDGKFLLTGAADCAAALWSVASGRQICTFDGHTGTVVAGHFSPDGRHILTGSADGTARLWDMTTRHSVATFPTHTNFVKSVMVGPAGELLHTFTTADGWQSFPLPGRMVTADVPISFRPDMRAARDRPTAATLSADGKWLVVGTMRAIVLIYGPPEMRP